MAGRRPGRGGWPELADAGGGGARAGRGELARDRPSAAAAHLRGGGVGAFAAVAADATLPATRAALVVTDGKDAAQDDPKAIAARQASLAAAAKQARLTMGLVGFSLDVLEPLAPWEAVAIGTGGPVERAVELGAGGLAVIRVGKALTR
ncbi:MAG: hypothetical protein R3B82_24705 [Sandaracinaceae bacterium]